MKKELEKVYNPKDVEARLYSKWLDKKYFSAKVDKTKTPYTIVIPPPNITGQLHLGHAWDDTIQDILIRTKRMQGYNALWLPGTDHASISTELKIVEQLAKEGTSKAELGREKYLERAWQWKDQYGGRIIDQLKMLGFSCDWDRLRFTMDDGLSKAVETVFIRLYEKGYIYRGEKLVNWCPQCRTTISDAEVNHDDMEGNFWHIKYPIKGEEGKFLTIATTRPETMLGDTALAVHPSDERYAEFVGKTVILPILNKEIPVIADFYVEKEFGTGVVKITPAHDPNDFEVGNRHNLPRVNIMNDDATINENGGKFCGMDRYDARKLIVKELEALGLLIKVEKTAHAVGNHERCHTVIEPLLKLQWFVKMEQLAKPAIEKYRTGELHFYPERAGKIYVNWLENIKDWCISRQLWWGHQIPVYYCDGCNAITAAAKAPDKCPSCGSEHFTRDEDTLDTWFSSALWPFSTLGWPDNTEELEYFYPTNVLVTGYDIIIFWVIRMVFSGLELTGELPFKDVFIHGLIRDGQGRKMSKSLGNGIDPEDVIKEFGADALRLTIIYGNAAENDMRFTLDKVESNRNFTNKLWNASRFVMMNLDGNDTCDTCEPTPADKWILSKANKLIKDVTEHIEHYELGIALQNLYDFIWDEYCDWYIEMVKPRLYNKDDSTRGTALHTLKEVLIIALKLLHPFAPFITEEIFTTIQDTDESIMISKWPEYKAEHTFDNERNEIELIKQTVKEIRAVRLQMNVPPKKKIEACYVVTTNQDTRNAFTNGTSYFKSLSSSENIVIQPDLSGISLEDSAAISIPNATIYIPLSQLIDMEKEKQRLTKEQSRLITEVKRIESKLNNVGFMSKAPEAVVAGEKAKLASYKAELEQLNESLSRIK